MNTKGQGALEYLLLIGGAVLVAAIVIALITGIPTTSPNPQATVTCATLSQFAVCEAKCNFSSGNENWSCKAMQANGIANAGNQGEMGSCMAVKVPVGTACPAP